jgi:hypothetical protein
VDLGSGAATYGGTGPCQTGGGPGPPETGTIKTKLTGNVDLSLDE